MKPKTPIPPRKAEKLLTWFLRDELAEEVLGDLDEKFYSTLEKKSFRKAKLNYWYQVINYIRPFAIEKSKSINTNSVAMYRNFLKTGYRNLIRRKGHAIINIGGLALGMMVAILIGLWVHYELTYNQNHSNYEKIAQVMQHIKRSASISSHSAIPFPLGPELKHSFGSDFEYVVMSSWQRDHILSTEDQKLIRTGRHMDVDAPNMLSLNMIHGSLNALDNPNSVLLNESTSKAFFGDKDPVGQLLTIDNELNVTVTGVYEDIPQNSDFKDLDYLATWQLYINSNNHIMAQLENPKWDNNSFQLFVQLADQAYLETVSQKIKGVKSPHVQTKGRSFEIFLHPMADWHLRSRWRNGVQDGGQIQYVWLFGIIGVFVLVLACTNFMNLSTAHSEKRSKEVGIRKAIGSNRGLLIGQFLIESFLVVMLAFVIALVGIALLLPYFNQLADKGISLPFNLPIFWMLSIAFIGITGFLSGVYPAFYLSSFKTTSALKGALKSGSFSKLIRKGLVVFQFAISVSLIIGTIIVHQQINHTKNRSVGYDQSGLIMFEVTTPDYNGKLDVLRNELLNKNVIVEMTPSSSPMHAIHNGNSGFDWEGKDPGFSSSFATIWVSNNYGKTVGWQVTEGRDFSEKFATDSSAFVINEAAVKYMGIDNPVGTKVKWNDQEYRIIGVVKDVVMHSPHRPVHQAIYMMDNNRVNWLIMKLTPGIPTSESLQIIEEVFSEVIPNVPFEYSFADQEYALKFAAEERIAALAGIFAVLAVFISCLGLYGLASYMAEQRTKEIGIRKVLGAKLTDLWKLMSKDFVFLVVVACLIATPLAYIGLDNWLNNYEYRTEIHWLTFAIASVMAIVITLLTISHHTAKTAKLNPVKSLRSE
ncbi:MAG: FtsX-like permease family protein [Cyclobacteriaceae bacterium]